MLPFHYLLLVFILFRMIFIWRMIANWRKENVKQVSWYQIPSSIASGICLGAAYILELPFYKVLLVYFGHVLDDLAFNQQNRIRLNESIPREEKIEWHHEQHGIRKWWQISLLAGLTGYLMLFSNVHYVTLTQEIAKSFQFDPLMFYNISELCKLLSVVLLDIGLTGGMVISLIYRSNASVFTQFGIIETYLKELACLVYYFIFTGYIQSTYFTIVREQHDVAIMIFCSLLLLSSLRLLIHLKTAQSWIYLFMSLSLFPTFYMHVNYKFIYVFGILVFSLIIRNNLEKDNKSVNMNELAGMGSRLPDVAKLLILSMFSSTAAPFLAALMFSFSFIHEADNDIITNKHLIPVRLILYSIITVSYLFVMIFTWTRLYGLYYSLYWSFSRKIQNELKSEYMMLAYVYLCMHFLAFMYLFILSS